MNIYLCPYRSDTELTELMDDVIQRIKTEVGCNSNYLPSAIALHWGTNGQIFHMDCHYESGKPLMVVLLLLVEAFSTQVVFCHFCKPLIPCHSV